MEFTKEFIELHRECIKANEGSYVWDTKLANATLDEIERLQTENELLIKKSDGLYLLLVDNPKSKRLADLMIKHLEENK